MRRTTVVVVCGVAGLVWTFSPATASQPTDPFAFFRPDVTLTPDERRAVDRGEPRVRVLPHRGREVAVFGAVAVKIEADRLAAWVREIAKMKESPALLAAGRFSDPPRVEDLARLTLDPDDARSIQQCRPGGCGLKLGAGEIAALQREISGPATAWRPRVEQAFRQLIVDRVRAYQTNGLAALPPYEDVHPPRSTQDAFAGILDGSGSLKAGLPAIAAALQGPPRMPAGIESFFYWSKERFSGKPVISATHVSIIRSEAPQQPAIVVVGKQLFATHYINSSLNMTTLLRGAPGGHNYLAYLNRSELDVIGGIFGGVARIMIHRRLSGEAGVLLTGLRTRLERGDPGR